MIKVKTETVKYKSQFDFVNELADATLNPALEGVGKQLEDSLKDCVCDMHKSESKGLITLNNKSNKLNFILTDFCCPEFKKIIENSLKR